MAKATFTSLQLAVAWMTAYNAQPRGTRGDVVLDLMGQLNLDPADKEEYKKVYNNVTQRKAQLAKHKTDPQTFPELEVGPKGARRSQADLKAISDVLAVPYEEEEESGDKPLIRTPV